MEFSRQDYWSRLPFPTPGDLPDPGIEPRVSCISCIGRRILYHCATWEAPFLYIVVCIYQSQSFNLSHPLLSPFGIYTFFFSMSVSTSALQICSSVLFFLDSTYVLIYKNLLYSGE